MGVPPSPLGSQGQADESAFGSYASRRTQPLTTGSASYYAQAHSLTIDFYTESSKRAATHMVSMREKCEHGKGLSLSSCSHLTRCTIPNPSINDCWVDSETSVQYLQQLLSSLDGSFIQGYHASEPRHLEAKALYCEVPILKSDNNLDLLALACAIHSRRAVPHAETAIPPIQTSSAEDEGLIFPCWSRHLMKHFDSHLSKEGIQDWDDSWAQGSGLPGVAEIVESDKEAICGLIDVEFELYRTSRVWALPHFSPLPLEALLTFLSLAEQYCPLRSYLHNSLKMSSCRTARPVLSIAFREQKSYLTKTLSKWKGISWPSAS